jgi:hypothetical protein
MMDDFLKAFAGMGTNEPISTPTLEPPAKGRRNGAGYTIAAAARELGVSYKSMLDAVRLGQVETIEWAGLQRITRAEMERIRKRFA